MMDRRHDSEPALSLETLEPVPVDQVSGLEPPPVLPAFLPGKPTRTRGRRRNRPKWLLKAVQRLAAVRVLLQTTLPAWIGSHRRELSTAGISFLLHLCGGLLLAAWLLPADAREDLSFLALHAVDEDFDPQQVELVEVVQPEVIRDSKVDSTLQQMLAKLENGTHNNQIDSLEMVDVSVPLDSLTDVTEIPFVNGEFGGRSDAGRRAAVKKFGGSEESERAVSQGLKWLQSIQRENGSWSFAEVGDAGQPGMFTTTDMGATSLALLCFLGAGHTHETAGDYQETVRKGLSWLVKNAELTSSGADLRGSAQANSGMYVQGIAGICICEASAMSPDDKALKKLAQESVRFIERAQHRVGGGWRYEPGDPGDTSVVGWQLMALHSAKSGGLKVQADTMQDTRRFLDSVDSEGGARYAYMPDQGPKNSMTAVGLLCRMYLGWKRDRPGLIAGVQHLASVGPSREDMYYNYYATQVLHHWGGSFWNTWNLSMREQLVQTQIQEGPGTGSWDVTDPHGYAGGRIYQTALSILTLEVYYRHLPIYRRYDELHANP
jgi:hypothetical protein